MHLSITGVLLPCHKLIGSFFQLVIFHKMVCPVIDDKLYSGKNIET